MKDAILWDLDGTLWDATGIIYQAWNAYAARQGVDRRFTQAECRGYCGKTLEQIARAAFPERDGAWALRFITGCCRAECIPLAEHGGLLYPGVETLLPRLHERYFMAVVSNCGLGYIESFFRGNRTGDWFDDYENAARTGREKGENIRLVMERNGIDRAVYIGDTQSDFDAAARAGIPFVHAAYGFGRVQGVCLRMEQLSQLPGLLAQLFPRCS